jgi:hypothetical protein
MTGSGTQAALPSFCSEQGKLPTAEEFTLAERDNNMSEQEKTKSYMEELNQWIDDKVVCPLTYGDSPEDPNGRSHDDILDDVYAAIRAKVLESYHNGQAAGPKSVRPARKEWHQYASKKAR